MPDGAIYAAGEFELLKRMGRRSARAGRNFERGRWVVTSFWD
jgi:hypothetical protein